MYRVLQVFAAAVCINNSSALADATPLWITIGVLLFTFGCLWYLSTVADGVSNAAFDEFIKIHPDLNGMSAASAGSKSPASKSTFFHTLVVRAAVAMMNLSCCGWGSIRRSTARDRRRCYCFCFSSRPTIRVLAFLPDAYSSVLYARYRDVLVAGNSGKTEHTLKDSANTASTVAVDARLDLVRVESELLQSDTEAIQAAAADFTEAANTPRCFLRTWRLRWTITHVWLLQV